MRKLRGLIFVVLAVLALVGCERQGPAERAGERIDDAAKNVSEGENPLRKRGPMEKAGEAIDEATDGNK